MTHPRVCLFAHPGAELFGADRMLLESVAGAREAGYDVVVALPGQGPLVDALRAVGARIVISRSLVLRKALLRPRNWPALARDSLRGLGGAIRLLSRVRPDCVYVNTITIPLWPMVAAARRVPIVSHVHEAEASGSNLINRALYAPHLLASRVLVNSEFSRATIGQSLRRLAARSHVVLNGVAGPEAPELPRARLDAPLRALFVGRLSPRKGPDVLVEAGKVLRASDQAVRIELLGSAFTGYEWFEEALHSAAEDGDVVFHGFHDPIWPFLADADVLIAPSTVDEPFGNTAVEGILALRPVIASDTSGLREAAGGYPTTWLVPPGDHEALAHALQELQEHWPQVREQLHASEARARALHAPAAYRARIASHLRAVMDDAGRVPAGARRAGG